MNEIGKRFAPNKPAFPTAVRQKRNSSQIASDNINRLDSKSITPERFAKPEGLREQQPASSNRNQSAAAANLQAETAASVSGPPVKNNEKKMESQTGTEPGEFSEDKKADEKPAGRGTAPSGSSSKKKGEGKVRNDMNPEGGSGNSEEEYSEITSRTYKKDREQTTITSYGSGDEMTVNEKFKSEVRETSLHKEAGSGELKLTRADETYEGKELKFLKVEGEGNINSAEFDRLLKDFPGADEFSKAFKEAKGENIGVKKGEKGEVLFSFKDSKGVEHSLSIGADYPRENKYETRQKNEGGREKVKAHSYFMSGGSGKSEVVSESLYQNGVLREKDEKAYYKNGDVQTTTYRGDEKKAEENVIRKNKNDEAVYFKHTKEDYQGNTREGYEIAGVNRIEFKEYSSIKGGPIDVRETENTSLLGTSYKKKNVYKDKNRDGKFDLVNEKVDSYEYNDTVVKKSDMNEWSIFGKNSYQDNVFDYLGRDEAQLIQHVEKREGTVVSTYRPADPNQKVEISNYYLNKDDVDIQSNPKALEGKTPDYQTFKTTFEDGTVLEKTGFPGSKDNYIARVNQKKDGWEMDITHTHLMDRKNPEKVNLMVSELSGTDVNKSSIREQASQLGLEKLPPGFDEFMEKSGGKVSVSIREEKNQLDGSVKKSLICVDPETGSRFVLNQEGDKTVSYFKDGKSGKELLDFDDLVIEKSDDKYVMYDKDGNGTMKKIREGKVAELLGEEAGFSDGRTHTKALRKGTTDTLSLFNIFSKASRTVHSGNQASGLQISEKFIGFLEKRNLKSSFFSNVNRANAALGSLVTSCTLLDIIDKGGDAGGVEYATLVGDMADLGVDVGKLKFVENRVAAMTGGSSKALKGLKIGGKALGVIGAGANFVSAVFNAAKGEYIGAGLDALAGTGSAVALFSSAAWAGPVGWGIAGLGIVGSLIYSNAKANEIHPLGESPLEQRFNMKEQLAGLEQNLK